MKFVGVAEPIGELRRGEIEAEVPKIVAEIFKRVMVAIGEANRKRFAKLRGVAEIEMDFHGNICAPKKIRRDECGAKVVSTAEKIMVQFGLI